MGRVTEIRCAVVGYGGAFNMGKHHADMMERTGSDESRSRLRCRPAKT
jgi:hypothetical protein